MMWQCTQHARSSTLGNLVSRLRKSASCRLLFGTLSFTINTLFRCIDHSMHRAVYHFIRELGVSSTRRRNTKSKTLFDNEDDLDINLTEPEDNLDADDDADINTSMNIEASADDAEAMMATTIVDFKQGDMLGKLLTFINQVHMSNKGIQDLLAQMCKMHMIKPIELHLWVCMCWGSLSDCLKSTLGIQKVRQLIMILGFYFDILF